MASTKFKKMGYFCGRRPARQKISPDLQGRLGLRHAEDHQTTPKEIGRPEAWTHDVWHVPEGSGIEGWGMQLHDVAG